MANILEQETEMLAWRSNRNRRMFAHETATQAASADNSDPFTYNRVMSQLLNNAATPECFRRALPLTKPNKSGASPYALGERFTVTRRGGVFVTN